MFAHYYVAVFKYNLNLMFLLDLRHKKSPVLHMGFENEERLSVDFFYYL